MVQPETRVRIFGRERWDLTELKKRLGVVSAELPGKQTLTDLRARCRDYGFFFELTLWPNLVVTEAMRVAREEVLQQIDAVDLQRRWWGRCRRGSRGAS